MDWKQFISSLVASMMWPLAAVTLAIVFRDDIRDWLKKIRKIGAGGVSFEMEALKEAGADVVAERHGKPLKVEPLDHGTLQLIDKFPDLAIINSYRELETLLLEIRDLLPDHKPHRNPSEVMKALMDRSKISPSVMSLFFEIRGARNSVVHQGGGLNSQEATELVRQTKLLQSILELIRAELSK